MTKNEEALEKFGLWYDYCIEAGLEPEKVIDDFGLKLLVTEDDFNIYEKGCEALGI